MADRLSADKKYVEGLIKEKIDKVDLLQFKSNGERIDIFMLAFSLGVKAGYQTKSQSKMGLVLESAVRGKDLALSFIYSVALQELIKENRESEITDTDVVFGIAEGYANTGFAVLENEVDFNKYEDETLIYSLIEDMDAEMAKLS